MNKKGFTFVELLAVIALISIVLLIAIPTIRYADKKFHQKDYNTKIELILNAAKEYGDDYKEIILYSSNGSTYTDPDTNNSYPAVTVTVRDLLNNGYVTKDNDIKGNDILDPRDDSSMLDKSITIYIKNNRAYAKYNN
ncbi:MAG: type II secretion system protein [Bacilli bacterium]|nr:type II secretion system protein [Bacilli bacterium]